MMWLVGVVVASAITAFNLFATIAAFSIYANFTGHFTFSPLTVVVAHILISAVVWSTLKVIANHED